MAPERNSDCDAFSSSQSGMNSHPRLGSLGGTRHTADMRTLFMLLWVVIVLAPGAGPARADQKDPRLPALFVALQIASDPMSARVAEQKIWLIWIHHDDAGINTLMRHGTRSMGGGDFKQALVVFDAIVGTAPDFAEGWNKRATLYYLMGAYEASVRDIEATLALEPNHFGALAGLGLIYRAIGKPASALKTFEKTLEIHPQSLGARIHIKELREELKGKTL